MIYGYLRVSTGGQTTDNQQLAIFKAGYKPDEWIEVHASATVPSQKRQIDRLLNLLKPGDTLVVTELSRLGRSVGQIAVLVDQIIKKKAELHCLKESIRVGNGEALDLQSKVTVTLFSLFAEIERDLISERTKEGIERARKAGAKIGRPKGSTGSQLDDKIDEVKALAGRGISKTAMANILGVSWSSLNHFLKSRKIPVKKTWE